jgi:hypothetical protein
MTADEATRKKLEAAERLYAAVCKAIKWPDEDEKGEAWDEPFAVPAYRAYRQQLRDARSAWEEAIRG